RGRGPDPPSQLPDRPGPPALAARDMEPVPDARFPISSPPPRPRVRSESRQVSVCDGQRLGLQIEVREEAPVGRVRGISTAMFVLVILAGRVSPVGAAPEG